MSREAFEQAVPFFVETAARVRPDQWETLALGVWNVRDLVGHTSRAMLNVEQYATVGTDRTGFGTAEDIAERGREAGRALGDDPAGAVREIATRVLRLIERLPDDHPVKTPAGERTLVGYLRSRVTELTIHTVDLANALGLEVEAPEGAGALRCTCWPTWRCEAAVRKTSRSHSPDAAHWPMDLVSCARRWMSPPPSRAAV